MEHNRSLPQHLQAVGITKRYGGVYALKGASFSLRAGEVHALVGENGAGKSTLARILAGSTRADSGAISIHGAPVEIATPLDAQRLGIGIIYQELDLFPDLTAGENIVIGNLHFPEGRLVSFRRMEEFCRPFLRQVGLACGIRQTVATLSIGQMQLLAIARALSMDARILLMDEPTSSLFDDAAERLFGLIAALKQRGVSIVYVSHKMDEIFRICDRATVLRDGETIGTVEMAGASVNELIRMMVGRELRMTARAARRVAGELVLAVEKLATAKLRDVSFELRRGEVLGIAGLVGSGRSELGAALFGLDRITSGTVRVQGELRAPRSPRDAMASGIGLLPEDRRLEGLMMRMSVLENATLAVLPRLSGLGFIDRRREHASLAPVARQLALNCASPAAPVRSREEISWQAEAPAPPSVNPAMSAIFSQPVSQLSGGNQQKVLLARWLLLNPTVLFLDDPTRGIDIGAKQDIYRLIDELAAAGKAIILVSSELPELLRCCDRILVLNEGRVTAHFDAAEATQEKIMSAATNAGAGA
jgi:ribose transport system ATP-binding protein